MELRAVAYDHPHARKLVAEVQQEYVRRYGEGDITPVDPADFSPPRGLFLVAYVDGVPVACGGWRAHDGDEEDFVDGDAELKRMYVVEAARGRGLARAVLAELERTAMAAGRRRLVLETGTRQPEAIALYTSSGYTPTAKFGVYKNESGSRCFAKTLDASLSGAGRDEGAASVGLAAG
ncbi:Acetyltransferase (GNAT) family protein [Streptoalloteichus tenebrarius]|uniref:Acetyltransferase (GNAT) family protein n=1 Tax=Streptoalloteichus tenebrarius (strain ATCC 17920 / DSM 40477 / JCM 4838 / CBS 697.72 / NBRC 16177 / NCIMB 11028 / NRRL B-12390 / A12253. 1 / ISP 5477) TaxID=1933 RepID=A0ABT1HZY9_STRSD|nr:GNAT family N-acetyltransferase [Streptoalloteichus tenebrarius]MCP2260930.1 Acetyltransferase (GNAT) family protein [Streptoalloteichus tenebrarius]BFF03308.1 GNAT family N-acetyltransferase [Streptoalloteichus tenebrarius]